MNTALILVDIQNDYFKGGRNELNNPEQAAAQAKQVLSMFRTKGLPVFHIQHISLQPGATFFLPDSDGINIHEQVASQPEEKVIVKHTPDSFFQTELQQELEAKQIKRLVLCGMMSHMCIDTTVRSAKRLGYETIVVSDACTTKDLTWKNTTIPAQTVHNAFMAALQGVFAKVLDARELEFSSLT